MESYFKKLSRLFIKNTMGVLLTMILFLPGCKKFLDEKPVKSISTPTTLADLQALLDNAENGMNSRSCGEFSEMVADNFYVTTADWQFWTSLIPFMGLNYNWDPHAAPFPDAWTFPYQGPIYYSNVVLVHLDRVTINSGEETKYNAIKGAALFHKAFTYHHLAQLFCKPYSAENGNSPGIVLKNTSNVKEAVNRATVQQTYDRIIADLMEAANLLPITAAFPTRPSKTAAYAALARVYLSMRDYTNAGVYANMALQQNSSLLDYNTVIPVGSPPIKTFNNPELIFLEYARNVLLMSPNYHKIDTAFYSSFDANDLRKTVFFKQNTNPTVGTYYTFQGSYNGSYAVSSIFTGLATDELYLIRAECYARANNTAAAIADLNSLMQKRWNNAVTYVPFTASNSTEALDKILTERRKELVWRGLRWSDIRRLNLEGANITLKRIIAGNTYTLSPNDLRSVMLIPINEINFSGIEQNPR